MKTLRSILAATLVVSSLTVPATVARAAGPTLRVCTGDPSLRYFKTAGSLAEQMRGVATFDVKPSNGSLDNLRKLASGDCDAALVQSDAYLVYAATTPNASLKFEDVGSLYAEYAQLLCNRDSGVGKVSDLLSHPETKVAVGPAGSGSATTWDALAGKVPGYNKVNTVPLPNDLALTRVMKGADAQCLLVVSGLNTPFMKKADEFSNGKLALIPFDDDAFDKVQDPNKHAVYRHAEVPGDAYPNLAPSGWIYGKKSVPTISVSAEFVILTNWYEANQSAYGDLSTAVLKMGRQSGVGE